MGRGEGSTMSNFIVLHHAMTHPPTPVYLIGAKKNIFFKILKSYYVSRILEIKKTAQRKDCKEYKTQCCTYSGINYYNLIKLHQNVGHCDCFYPLKI